MNRRDAKRRNLPPGYAVRVEAESGPVTYLAANGYDHTTEIPGEALWFETVEAASKIASSLSTVARRWIVTTVPDSKLSDGLWDGLHLDAMAEAWDAVFGPEDDGETELEGVRTESGTIHLRFDGRN
jgi:hypothetical protein